jgi:hypothetical protein
MQAFIEQDCKIVHEGKTFESGGSWMMQRADTKQYVGILYLYTTTIAPGRVTYHVGTWDGSKKVPCSVFSHWRGNFGDKRLALRFHWDGMAFTGIQAGDNQIVRCKQLKGR